jgi:cell division protein FtsB
MQRQSMYIRIQHQSVMAEGSSFSQSTQKTEQKTADTEPKADFSNILSHVKQLEKQLHELRNANTELKNQNTRMSQKTQADMQKIAESMYKSWLDEIPVDDEKIKQDFRCSMDSFVKNAAEDNGVWKMMVAASDLHRQKVHDFDKLQEENNELKKRVNGMYGDAESRIVGEKSKATSELSRDSVQPDTNMWDDFAKQIGTVF